MPRKRKNKVLARTKPTSEQSVVELVSDLALINNNVSSFFTDDEILLESLKKEEVERLKDQDCVSGDVQSVSVPVKKRVELQSSGRVFKNLKLWGSKFEIKHDAISLDKFFIRKALRNKKIKKSRGSKHVYIKSDDDDDVSFKVTEEQLDILKQNKIKDEVESSEINAENSLEDLKDVIDDFFPTENYDLEVSDLENLFSVKEETKELETAFDLLEVFFKDSENQTEFQKLMSELEENYTEPKLPNIQFMVDYQPGQEEEKFLVRKAGQESKE